MPVASLFLDSSRRGEDSRRYKLKIRKAFGRCGWMGQTKDESSTSFVIVKTCKPHIKAYWYTLYAGKSLMLFVIKIFWHMITASHTAEQFVL